MNSIPIQHISVSLLVKPYLTLTYSLPQYYIRSVLSVGARVLVPLGRRKEAVVGIITSLEGEELPNGVNAKNIYWVIDYLPFLFAGYLEMAKQLALRQGISLGTVLAHIIPAPLRSTDFTVRFFHKDVSLFSVTELVQFSEDEVLPYIELWKKGKSAILQGNISQYDVYYLLQEPPWNIKESAKKQYALLQELWEEGSLTKEELVERFGKGIKTIIEQLIKRSFIGIEKAEEDSICSAIEYTNDSYENRECTQEQKHVVDGICTVWEKGRSTELLFGITGSGKSRVYCKLIEHCLSMGKHAIILAPEVALVYKLLGDIQKFFQNTPYCVYHGYQNVLSKKNIFTQLHKHKEPCILIGTRSALFVPIENIGILILDEEHDASYKQDTGAFIYHAKEVAWTIAQRENALLLLGSATPDIKTFYASKKGTIGTHILTKRATGAMMPKIKFVDMKGRGESILASETIEALQETVARKEQAILLLNRRGYAPYIYCISCNTVQRCPHCEISMMYHKGLEMLRCSYCGYSYSFPKPCTACKAMDFLPLGCGTEKLQEEILALFPQEDVILRLDRDIARNPKTVETILQRFADGEASILVGTQMLAKGHDFPKVSLSVIVDADVGLHFPDYRATERTFQLLVQTAGRSGRGAYSGNVIVQTVDPEQSCWKYVIENDYEGLYDSELATRQRRGYPPFTHIALIRFRFLAQNREAKECIRTLGNLLRKEASLVGVTVLGPSVSPIGLVRGYTRYQCLLKAKDWNAIRTVYMSVKQYISRTKGIYISLDLDPVSMM